jgi:hypothetical protein
VDKNFGGKLEQLGRAEEMTSKRRSRGKIPPPSRRKARNASKGRETMLPDEAHKPTGEAFGR